MRRLKRRIGWMLMGVPFWTNHSCRRAFERNNWHARLYFFGSRLMGES